MNAAKLSVELISAMNGHCIAVLSVALLTTWKRIGMMLNHLLHLSSSKSATLSHRAIQTENWELVFQIGQLVSQLMKAVTTVQLSIPL